MLDRRPDQHRIRPLAISGLALLLALTGALGLPGQARAASTVGNGGRLADLAGLLTSFLPLQPLVDALAGPSAISTGSDGRLTVLLLGSDSRTGSIGRTDSIIIMGIEGSAINAASIPRDTGRVPNPAGGYYTGKVNSLLKKLRVGTTVEGGLQRFENVIEKWLQIEIDYHALVGFDGFTNLVDQVDPISVDITREIRDPKQYDSPGERGGVYFPALNNYSLNAWPRCNGLYQNQSNPIPPQYWCHRALPYVRSRKGPGNNDWVRSARQQGFVVATIDTVTGRSSSLLSGLISKAVSERNAGRLYTNLPLTFADALSLYNRLKNATLSHHVVFKPTGYAARVPGTRYYELKLSAVRAWTAAHLR